MSGPIAHLSDEGESSRHLAARVARGYYVDDRSKVELANELGISRFKVARLLDLARDSGIVTIEIHDEGLIDSEMSERLQEHLNRILEDKQYHQSQRNQQLDRQILVTVDRQLLLNHQSLRH